MAVLKVGMMAQKLAILTVVPRVRWSVGCLDLMASNLAEKSVLWRVQGMVVAMALMLVGYLVQPSVPLSVATSAPP